LRPWWLSTGRATLSGRCRGGFWCRRRRSRRRPHPPGDRTERTGSNPSSVAPSTDAYDGARHYVVSIRRY
jgi:hypothetical protein